MAKLPISVQLYTFRTLTDTDFPGTMNKLSRIGYKNVELAGYGNLKTAKDVKKALDDAGLKPSGAHVGIDGLEQDLNKVLDEHDVLGNKNIAVPWLAEDRRKDAASWKQFAKSMSEIAVKAHARGFNIAYHNHDFEFKTFDGKAGLDIFFNSADPLVKSELDVYWVKRGGQDPVAYINKLGSRVLLVHLKDMAAGADPKFAPVGTGTLDLKGVIEAATKVGAKFGIVEQDDTYDLPPLQAVTISFENLKKWGAV